MARLQASIPDAGNGTAHIRRVDQDVSSLTSENGLTAAAFACFFEGNPPDISGSWFCRDPLAHNGIANVQHGGLHTVKQQLYVVALAGLSDARMIPVDGAHTGDELQRLVVFIIVRYLV